MRLMKCPKNHFYDGDINRECPTCAVAATDTKTEKVNRSKLVNARQAARAASQDLWASEVARDDEIAHIVKVSPRAEHISDDVKAEIYALNVTEKLSRHSIHPTEELEKTEQEEKSAITDEGRTVSLRSQQDTAKKPVVGWLVGLNGEVYGDSFPLYTGRNFVGRGADQDVVIRGDFAVSRNKHAIVVYEPKGKVFLIQPGESREVFYMDDEVVLEIKTMNNGCILQIGDTKLKFIALCGKDFSWESTL